MSNLNFTEKRVLESYLAMSSGFVLNFSNRTFQAFVADSTGLNIYDDKIGGGLSSKANRLRHFLATQPDIVVGKLLKNLVEYKDAGIKSSPGYEHRDLNMGDLSQETRQKVLTVAERLLQSAPVPDAEVISVLSRREEFDQVAKGVLDAIHHNNPQGGLDRLHTFTTKFVRSLCEQHGLTVARDKPLHSIFGEYVKKLKAEGLIESRMTEMILKSSISTLDAFNDVRNNKSLAHDNKLLNESESLLIFHHVTSAIRFLWALEQSIDRSRPSVPVVFNPEL